MSGTILYKGISQLDNKTPIIVVATWNSKNTKTGDMIQTWILHARVEPHKAIRSGSDAAICGDCKYRGKYSYKLKKWIEQRKCYVQVHNAPLSVYRAYHRGKYKKAIPLPDIPIRVGAYGDPTAVPIQVWNEILEKSSFRSTGYTHQWKLFPEFKRFLMASVDNPSEAIQAIKKGWRIFAVQHSPNEYKNAFMGGLAQCPASKEAGSLKTCSTCLACNGIQNGTNKTASIIINPH